MYLQDLTKQQTLPDLLDRLANGITDYALVLAAVGTITMALLELLKAVGRARLLFHRYTVTSWVGAQSKALRQLLVLAIGGKTEAPAFYDQPTSKMLGQIQAAANVALDFPDKYPELFEFLTRVPDAGGQPGESDAEQWKRVSQSRAEGEEIRLATQARARLEHVVARKLDALQTRVEYRWARLNQVVAVLGGTALLLFLLSPDGPIYLIESARQPLSGIERVFLSIMGGLLAPFAKDVVTALSGLRTRRT